VQFGKRGNFRRRAKEKKGGATHRRKTKGEKKEGKHPIKSAGGNMFKKSLESLYLNAQRGDDSTTETRGREERFGHGKGRKKICTKKKKS